jgi:Flp pilus assembly protein TadB
VFRSANAYYSFLDDLISRSGGLAHFGPVKLDTVWRGFYVQIGLVVGVCLIIRFSGVAFGRQWIYFLAVVLGILAPIHQLRRAEKRKKQLILWELPGLMEIIAMIMEAGLSFDSAVVYIADRKRGYVS